jgi:hypothetical protein
MFLAYFFEFYYWIAASGFAFLAMTTEGWIASARALLGS